MLPRRAPRGFLSPAGMTPGQGEARIPPRAISVTLPGRAKTPRVPGTAPVPVLLVSTPEGCIGNRVDEAARADA